MAQLEEQELRQGDLKEGESKKKEESIVSYYLQVINLGQSSPAVMRRTVELLFKIGRGGDALELLNSLPAESQLLGGLERQAEQLAIEKKDFKKAEQFAHKAVDANPGDFQERLRLVWILLNSARQAEAEAALRSAVDFSKSDPDRWVTLVWFMVFTKQAEKAEQAVRDAEKNLPKSKAPLALAQCCEMLGRYDKDDVSKKKWYAEARQWYAKAQATRPDDLSIKRRLTKFFLDTNQVTEAKSQLEAMGTDAWAKRTLALVLASDSDPQEVRKALACFEPAGQPPVPAGQEGKTLEDPEDLRILARVLDQQARVLDVQRTPQYRKRAVEILESLTDKKLANSEDQFLLARLYEISGNWPKAREKYQELNLRTKNLQDRETLNRRPMYLAEFARSLLRNHQPGEQRDLTDAQELVDELEQLQPNALGTLILQVEIYKAENQPDRAAKLIEECAGRPNLPPEVLAALADMAEKLGQLNLAEKLYRQDEKQSGTLRSKMLLAQFLGHHGRAKEALDICEPLWINPDGIEGAVGTCIDMLLNGQHKPDPVQLNRFSGWLDQALKQSQNQRLKTLLLVGLANLRERQELYQKAEDLYKSAVKLGDDKEVAPSTSELIATAYNNLAWLTALKDGNAGEALEYINRAINLKGLSPDFLDTRGVVYLTAGDSQRAIGDLEKAITVAPSSSKYFHLAQAYLEAKNKVKAKQSLDAAKIKDWEQSGLHPLEKEAYQQVLTKLGTL